MNTSGSVRSAAVAGSAPGSTGSVAAAVVVAGVAAAGCLVMAVAHAGVEIPLLSDLGPGGNRVVAPAVVAFGVGALLFAVLATGLRARARWAWLAGLVVSGLAIASGVMQYRGVVSAVGIILAVALGGLLLTPGARRALAGEGRASAPSDVSP